MKQLTLLVTFIAFIFANESKAQLNPTGRYYSSQSINTETLSDILLKNDSFYLTYWPKSSVSAKPTTIVGTWEKDKSHKFKNVPKFLQYTLTGFPDQRSVSDTFKLTDYLETIILHLDQKKEVPGYIYTPMSPMEGEMLVFENPELKEVYFKNQK